MRNIIYKKRVISILVIMIIMGNLLPVPTYAESPDQSMSDMEDVFLTEPSVSAAADHSIFLNSDGTVWAAGRNIEGELGNGTTSDSSCFIIVDIDHVVQVETGDAFSAVLKDDGTVWTWGACYQFGLDNFGELGNGTNVGSLTPVQANISDVVQISADSANVFAIKKDGTVWAWGFNRYGQIGNGTVCEAIPYPVQVDIDNVKQISAGNGHTIAVKNDGTVWTWGLNHFGQLGNGSTDNEPDIVAHPYPSQININNVIQVSAGGYNSAALKNDGTVWMWGNNYSGQLGNATNVDSNVPVQAGILDVKQISINESQAIALKTDGSVWTWGSNLYCGLGDNSTIDSSSPIFIFNNAKFITSGRYHSFAIKNDNTLWAWGYNYRGQLGIGNQINQLTPVKVVWEPMVTTVSMIRDGTAYDLLVSKQIFTKDSDEAVTITVSPDWQEHSAGRVLISQGSGKYIESTDGVFEGIKPGRIFSSDGNIYLILIDASSKTVGSWKLDLQVTASSESQFSGSLSSGAIQLIEAFGVDVPESVPILGNSKFGLDIGSFSSEVEIDGNTFKVVLGVDPVDWEKDENGKWENQKFEGFVAGFKKAKEKTIQNATNYWEIVNLLKKTGGQSVNMILKDETKDTITVAGYMEGYFDSSGQLKISEGGLLITGEIKYSYQGMVLVGVVPVYYEVNAGGGLEFSPGFKGYVPDGGIKVAFTGSLTPSVFLEAGTGIGIPYAMTAGIKGKIEASLEIALERVYQKLAVEGSASFQLKGPFNIVLYKRDFAEGTWLIYETGNENTLLGQSANLYSTNNAFPSIDLEAPVTTEKRSYYVDTPPVWIGDKTLTQSLGTVELESVDYTNQEIKSLQENAYIDAAPIIADMDGKKVIAWITANTERANVNKSELVYSVYDETTETWSEPLAILDNGTPDFYPVMKDGYIVWQKANQAFADDVSLNDMSKASEIYLAKWNGTGFGTPVRLTDNATLDTQPKLAVDGGNVAVVWVTNTENNFMGTEGTNSILYSTMENGTFGSAVTLISNVNAITNMDVAYISNGLAVAYVTDGDNHLNTTDDREITVYQNGVSMQLTDNEILDSNPQFVRTGEQTLLFWYSNGNICYSSLTGDTQTVFSDAVSGLNDDFSMIANNSGDVDVLWTEVADGGAEIHGALYDGNEWSNDIQISDVGQTMKYPSGILEENGTIFAVFNRTTKVDDGNGYFTDGQADLCTITISPSYDISVSGSYYNEADFTPGTEAEVTVSLKNSGELSVTGLNVNISSDDNDINETKTLDESFKPGEEKEINITFDLPNVIQKENLTVKITPEDGDEYNLDDNEIAIAIGDPDIALESLDIYDTLPYNQIVATIANCGYSTAKNVMVDLRLDSEDGEIIDSEALGNLSSRASVSTTFNVAMYNMEFKEDKRALYVTLSSDSEEIANGNNSDYILAINPHDQQDYESAITGKNFDSGNGVFTLNAVGYNNTNMDKSAVAIATLYSDRGQMISSDLQNIILKAYDTVSIDFALVSNKIADGYTVKYFILDDNYSPLCDTFVDAVVS